MQLGRWVVLPGRHEVESTISASASGVSAAPPVSPLPCLPVSPDERIGDTLRQLAYAAGPAVILVAASSVRWSKADCELIARRAAGIERAVAVVSPNPATRATAQAMGLAAFESVAEAQQGIWQTEPHHWPLQTRQRLAQLKQPPALPRLVAPGPPAQGLQTLGKLLLIALTCGLGLIVIGLGVAAAPSGVVTVRPATRMIQTTFEAQARAGVGLDASQGLMPARALDISVEAQADATPTGRRAEAGERATGVALFINRRSEQLPIPYGALLETSSGTRVRFRTTQPAVLPARVGATVSVPITAVEPGPGGNVPANAINTLEPALALFMGVVNDVPTTGGAMSEIAVVTDEDRQQLRADLVERLRHEATTGLRAQLAKGERLAIDSVKVSVLSERWDEDWTRADYAALTLRVRAQGLGYDPQHVAPLAEVELRRETPADFRLVDGESRFATTGSERVTWENGEPTLWFGVHSQGTAKAHVNRQAVRDAIIGMTPAEASRSIARLTHLAEPAWVALNGPAWLSQRWGRLPWLPLRIDVVVLD